MAGTYILLVPRVTRTRVLTAPKDPWQLCLSTLAPVAHTFKPMWILSSGELWWVQNRVWLTGLGRETKAEDSNTQEFQISQHAPNSPGSRGAGIKVERNICLYTVVNLGVKCILQSREELGWDLHTCCGPVVAPWARPQQLWTSGSSPRNYARGS